MNMASVPLQMRSFLAAGLLLLVSVDASAQPREDILKEMRPASGIEEEPKSVWSNWPAWLVVAGVVVLGAAVGAGLAIRLIQKKRAPAVAASPQQGAMQEMRRLEAFDLPGQGQQERFSTELSNIVRRYIEQRFRLAATRQTTPEFLAGMGTSARLSSQQQAMLREFLEQCDLAKFAGLSPTPEQCGAMLNAARRFVQDTSFDIA
jgi:hypothetical protein